MRKLGRCLVSTTLLMTACAGRDSELASEPGIDGLVAEILSHSQETPDGRGFLPIAVAEGTIAKLHAGLAVQNRGDLDAMQLHALHVIHAIDPSQVESGPGMGFGLQHAMDGIVTRVRLAMAEPQADAEVINLANGVLANSENVKGWADKALSLAEEIRSTTDDADAGALVVELKSQADHIVIGFDADNDGEIRSVEGEGGLRQLEGDMDELALAIQQPPI
ncbi:MAG: hypothetical protein KDG54_15465 [Geminicoccaceae bacterium]|nr:hypothetical protein [Geminicoccaceae bacterium]